LSGGGIEPVNHAVEFERFSGGEVPPELVFLPEHQGELAFEFVFALPGNVAEDAGLAARRVEETGKHFQDGRLACAVGAEKADEFALRDGKGDVLRGSGLLVCSVEEALERAAEARLLLVGAVDLGQVEDGDGGVHFPIVAAV